MRKFDRNLSFIIFRQNIQNQITMRQTEPIPLKPNQMYHIFSHAVENNDLFYDAENYNFFLRKWERFAKGYFQTYAFCLMPNHFHLCVQTLPQQQQSKQLASSSKLDASLMTDASLTTKPISVHSKQINNFLSSYVQSLNKQRQRKGTLFRERFGRVPVQDVGYFRDLICYIHHNPIHHFGYEEFHDWAFSSFNSFTHENQLTFLNTEIPLNRFGGKEGLKAYHKKYKEQKRFTVIEEEVQEFYCYKHTNLRQVSNLT